MTAEWLLSFVSVAGGEQLIKLHLRVKFRRGLILGGLGLALVLFPSVGLGHARLVRSQPASNATLTQLPKMVELWFSEELESSLSTIVVRNQDGKQVDRNNLSLSEDGKKLQVGLGDLEAGTYTVDWKAVSTDQHMMKGAFAFTVAPADATSTSAKTVPTVGQYGAPPLAPGKSLSAKSESGTLWSMSLVRWLQYLAMMALFGGFAFHLLILGPSLRRARSLGVEVDALAGTRRFVQLSWLSVGLLVLSTPAALILQTATVFDCTIGQALSPACLSHVIRRTAFGGPWALQCATVIAVAILLLFVSRQAAAEPTAERNRDYFLLLTGLVVTALMFLSISMVGHAAAAAKEWPLAVFSDWLHLIAAGFWVGGLFHLAATMTFGFAGRQRLSVLVCVIPLFTRLAIVSTLVITVTGVYNSWIHVDHFAALWTVPYGKTLSLKLLLFLPMLALGGLNTFVIHRRARRLLDNDDRRETTDHFTLDRAFRRSIATESALGVAVLMVAAVLVFMQPARDEPAKSVAQTANATDSRPQSK